MYPSADYPSPTLSWYIREDAKREKGLQNEIDEAEIRAAAKGVKNKWHKRYWDNPEKFWPVINFDPYDWNEIIGYYVK